MIKTCLALSPTKANFAPLLFAGDLDQGFKKARQLGFDGVELNLRDSDQLDQDVLHSKLDALELQAISFGTGQSYFHDRLSLADPDQAVQKKVRQRLKGHIRFASRLGSMVVLGSIRGVLDDSSGKNHEACYQTAVEAVRELAGYAGEHGVTLLIEPINRYETNFINTIQEARDFIEQVDSPGVKILADTFHMNIEEADLVGALLRAGDQLEHVHFADSNRCAPGMGHINFNQIVKYLKQIKYQGWVSGEILPVPDDFSAACRWMRNIQPLLQD